MAPARWRRLLSHWRHVEHEDRIESLNRAPASDRFLTGNGFAGRCSVILNYGPIRHNPDGRDGWWFCKVDRLHELFAEDQGPESEIVLVTHNSDYPVGREVAGYIDSSPIRAWFATNLEVDDRRFRAIPVGIANPRWPHGSTEALLRVQASQMPKSRLFDASFSLETNPDERAYCVRQTRIPPSAPRPFETYLSELASSHFCISPRGNGIDCHRTWEALYLRTVPIVVRSLLTDHHPDLPMVVLDDWSDFGSVDFSPELYDRTIGDWSPDELSLDRYLGRIDDELERIGSRSAGR